MTVLLPVTSDIKMLIEDIDAIYKIKTLKGDSQCAVQKFHCSHTVRHATLLLYETGLLKFLCAVRMTENEWILLSSCHDQAIEAPKALFVNALSPV